ncbi:MAG: hypothetical protein HQL50_16330, partial [Magnetococcales bacterium]|nr:hypothetical protein [Magnetococcales bacterium]
MTSASSADKRPIRRLILAGVVGFLAATVLSELGRRLLDGYELLSPTLIQDHQRGWSNRPMAAPRQQVEHYLNDLPLDTETPKAWFFERPPPLTKPATPPLLVQRAADHPA